MNGVPTTSGLNFGGSARQRVRIAALDGVVDKDLAMFARGG